MLVQPSENGVSPRSNAPSDAGAGGLRQLEIKYLPLDRLTLNAKNARKHSKKQINQIATSIKELGFNFPIAINTEQEIIAGNGRFQAAKLLKLPTVPTVLLYHLTPAQQLAFAIADNKLTENSEWDRELLAEQIKFLSEVDLSFELETIGFEVGEIDVIIEEFTQCGETQLDDAYALPEATGSIAVSKPGDLWQVHYHRVLCGNCLNKDNFSLLMEKRKAAMIFVDPPYNVPIQGHVSGLGSIDHREFAMASGEMTSGEFTDFLSQSFHSLADFSAEGSIHYVCGDWRHMREFLDAGLKEYSELKNLCVWAKDNAGMGSFYRSQHELIFVFKSGRGPHQNNFELGQFGRYRTNLWTYGGSNSFSPMKATCLLCIRP
jgi:hypothetical protein